MNYLAIIDLDSGLGYIYDSSSSCLRFGDHILDSSAIYFDRASICAFSNCADAVQYLKDNGAEI